MVHDLTSLGKPVFSRLPILLGFTAESMSFVAKKSKPPGHLQRATFATPDMPPERNDV